MWVPDSSSASSSTSIACTYKQISMHAIARDTEAFPKPCVYIQLDEGSVGMGPGGDEDESEEEEESAELRLVPADDNQGVLGIRWATGLICRAYGRNIFRLQGRVP